jgi:hypothetical protein
MGQDNSSKAVAVTPEEPAAVASSPTGSGFVSEMQQFQAQVWTSLPPERKAEVIAYMVGNQADPIDVVVGKEISVEHLIAHRVPFVTDDGEEIELDRIILLTTDGHAYACTSSGIRRSLAAIMALYNLPPWDGGLLLTVTAVKTRRKFTTYVISPVIKRPPVPVK